MPPDDLHHSGKSYGRRMFFIAWLVLFGMLYLFFEDLIDERLNPNQAPQSQRLGGSVQVVLLRNQYGHYVATGTINKEPATFLLDTGATNISIPENVAKRLRLDRGAPVRVNTANGVITVYRTQLDSVAIGDLRLTDLDAHVNPHMSGDVLLGMSFLKQVQFEQRDRELTLKGPAPDQRPPRQR